jgi:anti-sigma regulatory factor (Ser/Thr protein kinase)
VDHELIVTLSRQAPREVRHSLEARYRESMERALLDDVTLLTSEVVTNAVQHSGCPDGDPLTVRARVADGTLRVEVVDQGSGVDGLTPRSLEPPSGLGYLHLLSDRWASEVGNSFHVWFEIDVETRTMLFRAPTDP